MHIREIEKALANYFRWHQQRVFVGIYWRIWEMDFAVVTKANYLWEVEIKRSMADWRRDEGKDKWKGDRSEISRMYYTVLPGMETQIPSFVPETTGILVAHKYKTVPRGYITEHRPAKRTKAPPLTDSQVLKLIDKTYYRYWHERMRDANVCTEAPVGQTPETAGILP